MELLDRERRARAQAEAASQAKDEFLAMLSHELRNPLAAICNAGRVLVELDKQHAFGSRAVEIISRQTKHLSRLVDDLLDVGRVTAKKVVLTQQRVNLAEAVQKSLPVCADVGRCKITGPKLSWRRPGSTPILIGSVRSSTPSDPTRSSTPPLAA